MGIIATGALSLGAVLLLYKYVDIVLAMLVMALLGFDRSAIRTHVESMLDKEPLVLRAMLSLRRTTSVPLDDKSSDEPSVGDRGG